MGNKLETSGGSPFANYFEDEGDIEKIITVHEDGTLEFEGLVNLDDAMHMLHRAINTLERYARLRPMPSVVLASDGAAPERYPNDNDDDHEISSNDDPFYPPATGYDEFAPPPDDVSDIPF